MRNLLVFLCLVFLRADDWTLSERLVAQEPGFASQLVFPLDQEHNHAPGIVAYRNGDLLVSWYRGSGERKADDVRVLGAVKKQGAENWSEPFVMADRPGFPDCNTCMMLDGQERLFLFWPTILANSWESCLTNVAVASGRDEQGVPVWDRIDWMLLKPDDFSAQATQALQEWISEYGDRLPAGLKEEVAGVQAKLGDKLSQRLGWQPRCKPIVLSSGRWLLPLYTDTFSISLMAISDDQGTSWNASGPLLGFGNIQPALFQRKDGTVVAYMRENGVTGRVRVCHSLDEGMTWGPVTSSEIPNPGSGLDGVQLASGRWLMICNDTTEGRSQLALMVSDDEGDSWKLAKYLEKAPSGSYHYPAIIQDQQGTIHAVYSYFVDGGKSMKYCRFSEAWLGTP
jgi:predicted neuraminidase